MGFLTKKREIDVVSIISISASAVILTFFACWLYYSSGIEKTRSTYDARIELYKMNMNNLQARNAELINKLSRIREELTEDLGEE